MGPTMTMEWQRLRTLPALHVVTPLAIALGVTASGFIACTGPQGTLSAEDTRWMLTGGATSSILPFVGLPMLIAGALAVLEDTRFRLATVLLAAQPRRTVLMAARLAVLAGLAVAVTLIQIALSAALSIGFGPMPDFAALPGVLGLYLLTVVLFTWAGAALGWMTSSTAASVGIALTVVFLLEPLAAIATSTYSYQELDRYVRYLPFTAARDSLEPNLVSLTLTVIYALLLLSGAWFAVRHRDY